MEKIEDKINLWSENLALRITEIKLMDVDQLKVSIATYIKMALHDCLKIDVSELEREYDRQKFIFSNYKGDHRHIQSELIRLKSKMKERKVMKSQIEQIEKLGVLIKFLKEKHPEIIIPFYEQFNEHINNFSLLPVNQKV